MERNECKKKCISLSSTYARKWILLEIEKCMLQEIKSINIVNIVQIKF